MPLHPSTARAIRKNIERMTLYLGYAETGQKRHAFLKAKAKAEGFKSISELIHSLINQKYHDFPQ